MDENEEFEFRARAEREAAGAGQAPKYDKRAFDNGPLKIGKEGLGDSLREVLRDTDWLTRNIAGAGSAVVNAADVGDVQKTIHNAGDHQADGIHVGGNKYGWAGGFFGFGNAFRRRTLFQSMDRTEFASADFIYQRSPLLFDEVRYWGFMS